MKSTAFITFLAATIAAGTAQVPGSSSAQAEMVPCKRASFDDIKSYYRKKGYMPVNKTSEGPGVYLHQFFNHSTSDGIVVEYDRKKGTGCLMPFWRLPSLDC